ncbi:MAG: transposase [Oscillospiraceae bacterium]|nr:transposase [Oscillospiraceae bacterium]
MNHPERKQNRIPGYDYATPNYYFITICTHQKQCLFGTVEHLNGYGQIAADLLLKIPEHFPLVTVDKFVVMPNHIHAIIILQDASTDARKNLSVIIGQYKAAVSQKLHGAMPGRIIWQKSFYDRIIRNEQGYQEAWHYIDENPVRWYVNRGLPYPHSPDDI